MRKNRIALIFGTRPEAIKLCPLVTAMRRTDDLTPLVCVTGQHRELLDQVLSVFEVEPDRDLGVMTSNQGLAGLTARLIEGLSEWLTEAQPDAVVVQGDTATAFCGALAAFYQRIPVAHVEAGLRTGDKFSPFPEEINRVLVGRLADLHFAPTDRAAANLLAEGIAPNRVQVTGNTVVDALQAMAPRLRRNPPELPPELDGLEGPFVLVTAHRRETFGSGIERLCEAFRRIAAQHPHLQLVYPVHPNPHVRSVVEPRLAHIPNIRLCRPLDYLQFLSLLDRCVAVVTDSGGVQEEAPCLNKPVLVTRDKTERQEAVDAGAAALVGVDPDRIVDTLNKILTDDAAYQRMSQAPNPFGDGKACERIVASLRELGLEGAGEAEAA